MAIHSGVVGRDRPVLGGGVVEAAPPVGAGGQVAVRPPMDVRGVVEAAPPVGAGGQVAVRPPVSAQGRVGVQEPMRRFDWVLALFVYVGVWGQLNFQNETHVKTGETHDAWKGRVIGNLAVAKRELELAWAGRNNPVRQIDPQEAAHVQAFVGMLREMCRLDRITGVRPLKMVKNKERDVDPPLWDVIVRHYVEEKYGRDALTDPLFAHRAPPLIV